jgi:hypothetical protein
MDYFLYLGSYKKADIYKIKEDLESFGNTFRNIGKRDIESLWQALKDAIQNTIAYTFYLLVLLHIELLAGVVYIYRHLFSSWFF